MATRSAILAGAMLPLLMLAGITPPITGLEDERLGEDVVENAVENLYGGRSLQVARITTEMRSQSPQVLVAQIVRHSAKSESKSLLRLLSPPELRDTAVLILRVSESSSAFLYLPDFRIVRRIESHSFSSDLLFGTDLTLTDLDAPFGWEFAVEHRDEPLDLCDRGLRFRPKVGSLHGYSSVVGCVLRERSVFSWLEFYSGGELLRRVDLDATSIVSVGERLLVTMMRVSNPRRTSSTDISVKFAAELSEVPRSLFSLDNLERGSAEKDRIVSLRYSVASHGEIGEPAKGGDYWPGDLANAR